MRHAGCPGWVYTARCPPVGAPLRRVSPVLRVKDGHLMRRVFSFLRVKDGHPMRRVLSVQRGKTAIRCAEFPPFFEGRRPSDAQSCSTSSRKDGHPMRRVAPPSTAIPAGNRCAELLHFFTERDTSMRRVAPPSSRKPHETGREAVPERPPPDLKNVEHLMTFLLEMAHFCSFCRN